MTAGPPNDLTVASAVSAEALKAEPPKRFSAGSAHEMTSLDERLGWLLLVRIALVAMVAIGGLVQSAALYYHFVQIVPVSLAYLLAAGAAEGYRRTKLPGRMLLHRAILPLDAVYLCIVATPSGGAMSPMVILFAVQLIAVTILGSPRSGLRVALWDTFLFVMIPTLNLSRQITRLLWVHVAVIPTSDRTALAIMGFWAVAICTSVFTSISERELRRSKTHIAALADMASELEPMTDEEQILGVVLETLVTGFSFRRGALWCSEGSRSIGLSKAAADAEVIASPVPLHAHADRIVEGTASGEPQLFKKLSPDANPVATGLLPGAHNVVVLGLQIDKKSECQGIILLEYGGNPVKARLPKRTLMLLGQFASHAALVVSNARLLAERERLAAIDGLTGLANRREFDRVLAREVKRSERSQEPLSLVVIDVDHFKAINDTRGHLGGDEVLRSIAEVLREAIRDMDLVARYGGEEFAMVLPRCDQADAVRVVERVTAGCRQNPDLEGVTVSSGVATMPFNASDALSLIAASDEALYESKRSGRNRYSVSARNVAPSSVAPLSPLPSGPSALS